MAARKAVSKRARFEVFKRDRFTCQYCGNTPPAVVLECDHVISVADGGSNDRANLVTACFDCNRGKAGIPLSVVPESVADQIARRREVAEQISAFNRLLDEERQQTTEDIEQIGRYWCRFIPPERNQSWTFGAARAGSIRSFLTTLRRAEILDAVDMAFGRFGIPYTQHDERQWKYFCGICWNRIRERKGGSR